MPQRIDYQLTSKAVQEIDETINHAPEPEVRQQAMALKLFDSISRILLFIQTISFLKNFQSFA
jgi:hypothetical protein